MRQTLAAANLVLLVFDLSQPWTAEDASLAASLPNALLVFSSTPSWSGGSGADHTVSLSCTYQGRARRIDPSNRSSSGRQSAYCRASGPFHRTAFRPDSGSSSRPGPEDLFTRRAGPQFAASSLRQLLRAELRRWPQPNVATVARRWGIRETCALALTRAWLPSNPCAAPQETRYYRTTLASIRGIVHPIQGTCPGLVIPTVRTLDALDASQYGARLQSSPIGARGGIGRRASLRGWWPQGRAGSTPVVRT